MAQLGVVNKKQQEEVEKLAMQGLKQWVSFRFEIAKVDPVFPPQELGGGLSQDLPLLLQLFPVLTGEATKVPVEVDAAAVLLSTLSSHKVYVKNGNQSDVWRDDQKYARLLQTLLLSLVLKYEGGQPVSTAQLGIAAHVREAAAKETIKTWFNTLVDKEFQQDKELQLSSFVADEPILTRRLAALFCALTSSHVRHNLVAVLDQFASLGIPRNLFDDELFRYASQSKAEVALLRDAIFMYFAVLRSTLGPALLAFEVLADGQEAIPQGRFQQGVGWESPMQRGVFLGSLGPSRIHELRGLCGRDLVQAATRIVEASATAPSASLGAPSASPSATIEPPSPSPSPSPPVSPSVSPSPSLGPPSPSLGSPSASLGSPSASLGSPSASLGSPSASLTLEAMEHRRLLGCEEKFGGKWICTSEEHTDDFLAAMGIGWVARTVLGDGVEKEILIITPDGESIDIEEKAWPCDDNQHFEVGHDSQLSLPHGAGTITVHTEITEDHRWISVDKTHNVKITREILDDGRMKQTMESETATATRWYTKVGQASPEY